MRELTSNELNQVAGGEFRLSPDDGGTILLGIGAVASAVNPLLGLTALFAATMVYGSRDDINAISETRRLTAGGSGGGARSGQGGSLSGVTANRTGGSRISESN